MICVSIAHIAFSELKEKISDFEMLELRLDLLDFTDEQYQYIIDSEKPVIATYRYGNAPDKDRIEALQKLIELGIGYVDIEVDANPAFIKTMMNFAQTHQCKIIMSYHNFELTPDLKELHNIIKKSESLDADYIKVVTMAQSKNDVSRVLSLYNHYKNLIAFNMGELGKISRLACLYLGAEFTYASISSEHSTADGQFENSTLIKLRQLIK